MKTNPSREPWFDQATSEWAPTRIRNVAQLSPSFSAAVPDSTELCAFVPMERLSEHGAVDTTVKLEFQEISPGLTLFEAGDVLFAKITPCMENGKGAFVAHLDTRYAFGSTEFHVLRPNHRVAGSFLYYFTFNPTYRAYAAENMVGAAGQRRVSSRFLKDTRIFLPSTQEQDLIAAFLDRSCEAIDAARARKAQQLDLLASLRLIEIQRAVTLGLMGEVLRPTGTHWMPELPASWRLVSLLTRQSNTC